MPLHTIAQQTEDSADSGMKSVGTAATMKEDSDDGLFFCDMDMEDTTNSDSSCSESESYSDYDSDEDDSDDEELTLQMLQNLPVQALRRADNKFGSLGDLRGTPLEDAKSRFAERSTQRTTLMPKTFSAADLQQLMAQTNPEQSARKTLPRCKTSPLENRMGMSLGHIGQTESAQTVQEDDGAIKPDDHLAKLLGNNPTFFTHNDDALEGFFLPNSQEFKSAWVEDLTRAVRDEDIPTLEMMHRRGAPLQACNAFGESIIHLAVRRSSPEVLRFLLQDAGVCMRVRCDLGRSPVHDAAWCLASNPKSYQMMALLLNESPMQLLIKDQRGYTPLQYVPRKKWAECNAFLDRQHKKGRFSSLMMK